MLAGVMLVSMVAMLPEVLFMILGKGSLSETNDWYFMFLNFSGLIGGILAFNYFCCRPETEQNLKFNLSLTTWRHYLYILPMMFGLMLVVDIMVSFIPTEGVFFGELYQKYSAIFQKMAQNIPVFIISTVVLAPVIEEVIFRGIIQKGLINKGWKPQTAIWFSAIIFGVVHGNPWQLIGAVLLGYFLGLVYHRTKSLFLSIFLHAFNNLLSCLMIIFTQKESFIDLIKGNNSFQMMIEVKEYHLLIIGIVMFLVPYFKFLKEYK